MGAKNFRDGTGRWLQRTSGGWLQKTTTKKNGRRPQKKWKTTLKRKKKGRRPKKLKWKTNQSTKINLIGCDKWTNGNGQHAGYPVSSRISWEPGPRGQQNYRTCDSQKIVTF